MDLNRRHFLKLSAISGAAVITGCRTGRKSADDAPPRLTASTAKAALAHPAICRATEANIEGPFWKSGAPDKLTLVEAGDAGTRLQLAGSVRDVACATIAGAEIDVWQANHRGAYDNDGFRFRGKLHSNRDGNWQISTIVPGRYLNGKQYRPAHIHVKLSAPGFAPLTTQLYFPDDPYNKIDPFIAPSLIMDVKESNNQLVGGYDFVLT